MRGAHIEYVAVNQWQMSGPWGHIIIERIEESEHGPVWTTRTEETQGRLYRGRCEGALTDAYSRVMGYQRG